MISRQVLFLAPCFFVCLSIGRGNFVTVRTDNALPADAISRLLVLNNSANRQISGNDTISLQCACLHRVLASPQLSRVLGLQDRDRKIYTSVHSIDEEHNTAKLRLCADVLMKTCQRRTSTFGSPNFLTEFLTVRLALPWKWLLNCCREIPFYELKSFHVQFDRSLPSLSGMPVQVVRKRREAPLSSHRIKNCPLILVADHLFFTHVGGMNVALTAREMLSAVKFADAIFRSTDFDGDGMGDNVGFSIANITVIETPSASGLVYGSSAASAREYLDNFAHNNFEQFCLAVAFTYIDFEDGSDAASFMPQTDPSHRERGICSKIQFCSRELKVGCSFNTLVVSYLNRGVPTPRATAHITLAHELGHSFGSEHDTADCQQSIQGHSLMHSAFETKDDIADMDPQFSLCSIRQINPVLAKQGRCLTPRFRPMCGNTIVDDGEECDCGTQDMCEMIDKCCTPADVALADPDKPCKLRSSKGAQCSGITSPCCTPDCKFTPAASNRTCRGQMECSRKATCDGSSSDCLPSLPKPNGTLCRMGSRLCERGLCLYSVCKKKNLTKCLCPSKDDHCKVCCKENATTVCLRAEQFGITGIHGGPVYHPQGDACGKNYSGSCNAGHVCMYGSIPPYSPDTFSQDEDMSFLEWLYIYWQHVLIVASVFLAFVFGFYVVLRRYRIKQARALEMAHVAMLLRQSRQRHQYCAESLESVNDFSRALMQLVETGNLKRGYVNAVTRLHYLFPSAPLQILTQTVELSSKEDVAVRLLLNMEYPMVGSRSSLRTSSMVGLDTTGMETGHVTSPVSFDVFDSSPDLREPPQQLDLLQGDMVVAEKEQRQPCIVSSLALNTEAVIDDYSDAQGMQLAADSKSDVGSYSESQISQLH
ncbi:hypothetical protein BaRGS_00036574 [Batillaria attramentaria]|uniref:Uncharacterized protein n=1 Tax=Batillaria attramentaria TaxID=370345 RepID=A0ABD0JCS7_9CAEN